MLKSISFRFAATPRKRKTLIWYFLVNTGIVFDYIVNFFVAFFVQFWLQKDTEFFVNTENLPPLFC